MDALAGIAGTLFAYKTMADGTLRVTIDFAEFQAGSFHALFPRVGKPVAIAPMVEPV